MDLRIVRSESILGCVRYCVAYVRTAWLRILGIDEVLGDRSTIHEPCKMALPWFRVHVVVLNDPGRLLAVHLVHTGLWTIEGVAVSHILLAVCSWALGGVATEMNGTKIQRPC